MSYPLLAPGSLVKPHGLNFHWLRVVDDPGPENLAKRIVTLARTEPERFDQWIKVRRRCRSNDGANWANDGAAMAANSVNDVTTSCKFVDLSPIAVATVSVILHAVRRVG